LCSGLQLTDPIEIPENRAYRDTSVLHQKYVVEWATLTQIAKEFLCSRSAVVKALVKAGIPLRQQSKEGCLPRSVGYGTVIVEGRRVPSQVEERVIKTITSLRRDGLSFDKIADRLTQLGIPTKTRRKKWNGGCIRAIILRHAQQGVHSA